MKRCLGDTPPSWLEKDPSVLNDRDSNNADLLGAEYVQPTTGPVLAETDTSSPERSHPFAGTMPVLTGEPTDRGPMGVATTTPLM